MSPSQVSTSWQRASSTPPLSDRPLANERWNIAGAAVPCPPTQTTSPSPDSLNDPTSGWSPCPAMTKVELPGNTNRNPCPCAVAPLLTSTVFHRKWYLSPSPALPSPAASCVASAKSALPSLSPDTGGAWL